MSKGGKNRRSQGGREVILTLRMAWGNLLGLKMAGGGDGGTQDSRRRNVCLWMVQGEFMSLRMGCYRSQDVK